LIHILKIWVGPNSTLTKLGLIQLGTSQHPYTPRTRHMVRDLSDSIAGDPMDIG